MRGQSIWSGVSESLLLFKDSFPFSLPCAYLPFLLSVLSAQRHTIRHMEKMHALCRWPAIPLRETACSHSNGLPKCLYSWHTRTPGETQKHRHNIPLKPHQRNSVNPKITTEEKRIHWYLGGVQVHSVHGQFLGIFQKLRVGLCWCHSPKYTGTNTSLRKPSDSVE